MFISHLHTHRIEFTNITSNVDEEYYLLCSVEKEKADTINAKNSLDHFIQATFLLQFYSLDLEVSEYFFQIHEIALYLLIQTAYPGINAAPILYAMLIFSLIPHYFPTWIL